ncbi:ACT domain-containing protein [Candidatus Micrarchaeota archaeon]|nr:ACT domain-containing protein [Candidatus Micrarchaeota archaeon]
MMKELTILAKDKPGVIADISYIMAMKKVNIESIDAHSVSGNAVINLGVQSAQYEHAKAALEENKYAVLPMQALVVKIPDKPGALAELSKKLADSGINISDIHVLGKDGEFVYDSIVVDKPNDAKKLLGDMITEGF